MSTSQKTCVVEGISVGPCLRVRPFGLAIKRVLDVLLASSALLIAVPPMLVIALLIRVDSRGPALLGQTRIGHAGRAFRMWKFRSMVKNASDETHRRLVTQMMRSPDFAEDDEREGLWKLTDDPRLTRVGRWLRRTSLDELPQLINVLRGEMSLVGPRPALPYEIELYSPRERRRLLVPQGMTGLWQVSGRNRLSYRTMLSLDLDYVERWSLWLDLQILVRTVTVVLRSRDSTA